MSEDYQRIEIITGCALKRRWTIAQKLGIIEESLALGASVSMVARRHGVAPNLLYRWRRLMSEGGAMAVGADENVVAGAELRRLEDACANSNAYLAVKRWRPKFCARPCPNHRRKNRYCGRSCP